MRPLSFGTRLWLGHVAVLAAMLALAAFGADWALGRVVLGRVDISAVPAPLAFQQDEPLFGHDANQGAVEDLPGVIAFRDGQPATGFVGAYPEPAVNEFVDSLLPTAADLAAEEARAVADAGDVEGAEAVGMAGVLHRAASITLARLEDRLGVNLGRP